MEHQASSDALRERIDEFNRNLVPKMMQSFIRETRLMKKPSIRRVQLKQGKDAGKWIWGAKISVIHTPVELERAALAFCDELNRKESQHGT